MLIDTCHHSFTFNDIKEMLTLKHFIFMRNVVCLSILSNLYVKSSLIDHHENQSTNGVVVNKKTVNKSFKSWLILKQLTVFVVI